jgi:hypothetical protein
MLAERFEQSSRAEETGAIRQVRRDQSKIIVEEMEQLWLHEKVVGNAHVDESLLDQLSISMGGGCTCEQTLHSTHPGVGFMTVCVPEHLVKDAPEGGDLIAMVLTTRRETGYPEQRGVRQSSLFFELE